IIEEARQRWALQKVHVVHRVGRIAVGEDIIVVDTASAHRRDAYEANVFIMDYLKTEAPFWKREHFEDGAAHWVEARASDQAAAQRWQERGCSSPDRAAAATTPAPTAASKAAASASAAETATALATVAAAV